MERNKRAIFQICLQVLFLLLCAGFVAWIFSNSLKDAEQSTAQSAGVVEIVQKVVYVIAPDSPIVTATGEDYDLLHKVVRIIAHFLEFALLGALLVWCWRTFTRKKIWFLIPCGALCIVPVVDEILQSFTAGRAMEFTDVCIDIAGGIAGGLFALLTLWLLFAIIRKRKRRKEHGKGELGNSPDKVQ